MPSSNWRLSSLFSLSVKISPSAFFCIFASASEESDGESLAYRDQFGKRIKLGSRMPPVPPWAEEAVEERQRPPEASGQQQRVRIFETTDASTLD